MQGRWQEGRWFADEEAAAETMGRWIGVVVVEGWGRVVETRGEGSQGGVWACCFDGMFGLLCLRIASSVVKMGTAMFDCCVGAEWWKDCYEDGGGGGIAEG